MKRTLLWGTLGASLSLAVAACAGDPSDDDISDDVGSGGKGSGGKASGGKASGGSASGGMAGSASGGMGGADPSGGQAGDSAAGGMGGEGSVLRALCEKRCETIVTIECPNWDDVEACTDDCVGREEPACKAEYLANVECESTQPAEGFMCVEVFAGYYQIAQSGSSPCEDLYDAFIDCAL